MIAMQEYGLREPEFIDMEITFRINLYRMAEEECLSVLKTDQDTDQDIDQVSIKENWSEAELTDKEKAILKCTYRTKPVEKKATYRNVRGNKSHL